MAEDSGGRFVDAPGKFDFHECRHMERLALAPLKCNGAKSSNCGKILQGASRFSSSAAVSSPARHPGLESSPRRKPAAINAF